MTHHFDQIYSFVYKAQLTEESLDAAGRDSKSKSQIDHEEIAISISLDALDDQHVEKARAMATVYTAVAAFENSVRELITSTMLDEVGENWWENCVSKKVRDAAESRREAEERVRWHAQRGDDPINYTMLPNLMNIIRNNQELFNPFIHDIEWAASVIEVIERSRNVIMHSGTLEPRDIARLGTYIRDWTSQVST